MRTVTIKIATKGSAFENYPEEEVVRILKEATEKIRSGYTEFKLMDINGNSCGTVKITGK